MNYSKFAGLGWRKCQLWLVALASLFLLNGQALAEVAANVSFVSGVVTASTSGAAARELAKGNDIFSGDSIDTADNGRIQMRFTDGGLVSLMPRTTFSVDEYLHEGKAAEDGSLVFGMLRGGMRTITGSIGKIKHENYELKTPVATLGIRGTEYVAVIGPPDTLRVHVGKGKVVITNDHGTLEVPEGRSAVVVLGSAPEFTEQGPLYVASALGGDKFDVDGLISQDPLWRDVVIQELIVPDTSVPPATGIPPNGPGYLMAGYANDGGSSLPFQTGGGTFIATFDQTTGDLLSINDPGTDLAGLSISNVGYLAGNISWGEFNDNGSNANLFGVQVGGFSPYVIGSQVQNMPTSGTLNYSLAGGTPIRSSSSPNIGQLNLFTLDIDLTNNDFTFDMGFTIGNNAYDVGGTNNLTTSGWTPNGFVLGTTTGVDMNNAQCTSCTFNANGFLAGPNAEQAGISYQIIGTQDGDLTGAAALTRP